jgi:hypothetical protein
LDWLPLNVIQPTSNKSMMLKALGRRAGMVPTGKSPEVRVAVVTGNTLLKFFFGEMLNQLREDGASRVHPSLFHPIDKRKMVESSLF